MRTRLRFAALVLAPAMLIAGGPPQELVGEWSYTETSTVGFTNGAGNYAPPSGTARTYHIYPTGEYKDSVMMQHSLYNCTDTVNITESGRVVLDGQRLIFDSRGGDLESRDNCTARFNYQKKIPPRQYVNTSWSLSHDRWGMRLCLSHDGANACYYRK